VERLRAQNPEDCEGGDLVKTPPAMRRRITMKGKDPAGGVAVKAKSPAGPAAAKASAPAPCQDAIPPLGCPKCRHSAKGCAKCRGNRKRVLENLGLDEAAAEGMAAATSSAVEAPFPPVNVADRPTPTPEFSRRTRRDRVWR
jgi:hypothetical protein